MKNKNEKIKKIAVKLLKEKQNEYETCYLLKDGSTHHETDNNNDVETFVFKNHDEIVQVLKDNFDELKKQGFVLFKKSNDGTPLIIETFAAE